jgi:hypothetical protein
MTEFRKRYPPHLSLPLHQSKAVKRTFSAFAVALFAGSLTAAGAAAATKPGAKTARPAATNPAVAECYKRSGGTDNPVTKRWSIHFDEGTSTVRSDTLRQCIGRATGTSPGAMKMRERCDRPPCGM